MGTGPAMGAWMRFLLGVLVMVFNVADNTTTFLCLRQPVPGFEVFEANPLARWLFEVLGLAEGLIRPTPRGVRR